MATERLEKLLQQEQQIKARIDREKAKLRVQERNERTGRLISWGVVIEQMLKDPDESLTPEQWANQCKRFLSDQRTLERALTGVLTDYQEKPVLEPV